MYNLRNFILGISLTIHVSDSGIDQCKYVQFVDDIKLLDICVAQSNKGSTISKMITCDNSGESPIFSEYTYNGESCDPKSQVSMQSIDNRNLLRSDSYNCGGGDCDIIMRLYDVAPGEKCDKTSDFKDEAFIQGYSYEVYNPTDGSTNCIKYDCSAEQSNVVIKDCWDNDFELAHFTEANGGSCDAYLNKYFGDNSLIHCGDQTAYNSPFFLPDPPSRAPTVSPLKTTDTYTTNFPAFAETITQTSESPNSLFGESNVMSGDNIYSLPAIPIEGTCFMITVTLLIICIYYLFIGSETKNVVELFLKPFIVATFAFNTISIACIMSISIAFQTMIYNEYTYKMLLPPYYIASICYVIGKFCLESVFMLRVYSAFKNNIFKINKSVLITLFILMIIVSGLWLFVFVADRSIQNIQYYDSVYILATIFDALLIISLLYLFIKRLQRVIIREAVTMRSKSGGSKRQPTINSTTSNSHNLSVTSATSPSSVRSNRSSTTASVATTTPDVPSNPSTQIDAVYKLTTRSKCQNIAIYCCCCMMNDKEITSIKSDLKSQNSSLVFIMTKLCLLSSVSLITTAVFGIYLFYELSMNQRYMAYALWTCDICINSFCLFLNFAFSNELYKKLCKLPHNTCQYVMENSFAAKISTNNEISL